MLGRDRSERNCFLNFCLLITATAGVCFSQASTAATASLNGASVPALTQLIDSKSQTWTLASGVVEVGGKPAGYSSGVKLLTLFNGVIFQENTSNLWWSWNGTTWVGPVADPRVTSANNTNIPATTYIVDSAHDVWVISAGVVYENGALAGYSSGVVKLLYSNNVVYQENKCSRMVVVDCRHMACGK